MTSDSCNGPQYKSLIAVRKEEVTAIEIEEESRYYPLPELTVELMPCQAKSIIDFLDDVILQLALRDDYNRHYHLAHYDVNWWAHYPDITIFPVRNISPSQGLDGAVLENVEVRTMLGRNDAGKESEDDPMEAANIVITASLGELLEIRDALEEALRDYAEHPKAHYASKLLLPQGFPSVTIVWEEDEDPDDRIKVCPTSWLAWDYDYVRQKLKERFLSFDASVRDRLLCMFADEQKEKYIPKDRYDAPSKHPLPQGCVFEFLTRSNKKLFGYIGAYSPSYVYDCHIGDRVEAPGDYLVMILENERSNEAASLEEVDYLAGPYRISSQMFFDGYFQIANAILPDLFPLSEIGFLVGADEDCYAFRDYFGKKLDYLPSYQGYLPRITAAAFFHAIEFELAAKECEKKLGGVE